MTDIEEICSHEWSEIIADGEYKPDCPVCSGSGTTPADAGPTYWGQEPGKSCSCYGNTYYRICRKCVKREELTPTD